MLQRHSTVPEIIHSYVDHAYKDCSTCLKYKCGISPSIPVNRGVKQGDPMSPIQIQLCNIL